MTDPTREAPEPLPHGEVDKRLSTLFIMAGYHIFPNTQKAYQLMYPPPPVRIPLSLVETLILICYFTVMHNPDSHLCKIRGQLCLEVYVSDVSDEDWPEAVDAPMTRAQR